jgi:two-component system response regulator YesN
MRIMIVDDEVIIRNGLSTVIDWKELGIELLPPASSAEEALERISLEKPHILLTDIRMSGKNGIELAREVKEMFPDMEIVILTGYDDFTYAQQALREGVIDYLLKTSRPEEIIKAAMKAKQNIMEKWEAAKQENMHQAAFRSQQLERLLSNGLEGDAAALEQIKLWFRENGVIKEDEKPSMQVMLFSASGWGEGEYSGIIQGASENIMYELIPSVTLLKEDSVLMVMRKEADITDESGLKRAIERVQQTLKCTVFAALGCAVSSFEELKHSFQEANHVYSFKGIIGSQGLFITDDVKNRTGSRTLCSEKEEAELAELLINNNPTELRHWVNQRVRSQIEDPSANLSTLLPYLQSMVISGYRWLGRVSSEQTEPRDTPIAVHTLELKGRPEDEVFKLLSWVMNVFHQSLSHNSFAYIGKSIAYIKEHLDKNLSLQHVAKFVHLNPNHFSEVFKRETGCTYIEFVTQERMKRAIEILKGSQAKIREVANRVGYEDTKYFTQQFKKYTGQTPSEFRQLGKDFSTLK